MTTKTNMSWLGTTTFIIIISYAGATGAYHVINSELSQTQSIIWMVCTFITIVVALAGWFDLNKAYKFLAKKSNMEANQNDTEM